MPTETLPFDAVHGKLRQGVTLVEASAGTGKTYAITMLVLRAVVEKGIPLANILIVTFTIAATEELRRRIRSLLATVRQLLAGESGDDGESGGDATLRQWVATLEDRRAALSLVQVALADIDGAEIYTIHGFCQRMLVDQALESGRPYEVELLTDVAGVREEIAADFWRSRLYPLAPLPCAVVVAAFATPAALLASVIEARRQGCRLEPPAPELEGSLTLLQLAMERLVGWWHRDGQRVEELFRAGLAAGHFKKTFADGFDTWWERLRQILSGQLAAAPVGLHLLSGAGLLAQLNGNVLRGEKKRLAYLEPWPLPQQAADDFLAAAADLVLSLRVELAEMLRRETAERLARQGCMGFDDLVHGLYLALRPPGGKVIAHLVGDRYRMALIDEFQDTDSEQWHIFHTLFGSPRHALYLIGDPKQAIYRFRGADIHSYFAARQAAQWQLTLEANYRSHPLLLAEINRLFSSRPQPFLFSEKTLDYRPVAAGAGLDGRDLVRGGRSLAAMVYCHAGQDEGGGRWSSARAGACLRAFVIAEIAALLSGEGRPTLCGGGDRPLAPRDIAILVRSHFQAEEYRRELAAAGIPAVLASRRSVFDSEECRQLHLLLSAIADPGHIATLKRALALPWFGRSGDELYRLWSDEGRFEEVLDRFHDYHRRWREDGFLAMMYRLLHHEGVLTHLATAPLAERAMANVFHLLALVQQAASADNLTVPQVQRWLEDRRQDSRGAEDSELLLESDEDAVRLVTMHGAKGLEYPVVFCPYLWYRSDRLSEEGQQVVGYDEEQRLVVDLGSPRFAERREAAAGEQLAEDLRLLYVAVTRARLRCYVMWADVKRARTLRSSFDSALGYLLFPDGEQADEEQERLFTVLGEKNGVEVRFLGRETPGVAVTLPRPQLELSPRLPSGRSLYSDRQVSSYSALAMLSDYGQEEALEVPGRGAGPAAGLPAGAGFGNVVHDLLDQVPFAQLASGHGYEPVLAALCRRHGVEADGAAVAALLSRTVRTRLLAREEGANFTLAGLAPGQCLREMEFYLQVGRLATPRLNALLAGQPGFVSLEEKTMHGHLTGFVDLICQAAGKFWLIDYKTNHLGSQREDYLDERLALAMRAHNYGLQYWIYTVVLHRYLRRLLPGYRYGDHFGGVLYLFVRGMEEDIPGSGVFATLPPAGLVEEVDRVIGERGGGGGLAKAEARSDRPGRGRMRPGEVSAALGDSGEGNHG